MSEPITADEAKKQFDGLYVSGVKVRVLDGTGATGVQAFADVTFNTFMTNRSFPIIVTKQGIEFMGLPATIGDNKKTRFYNCTMDRAFKDYVQSIVLAAYHADQSSQDY